MSDLLRISGFQQQTVQTNSGSALWLLPDELGQGFGKLPFLETHRVIELRLQEPIEIASQTRSQQRLAALSPHKVLGSRASPVVRLVRRRLTMLARVQL